MSRIGKIPIEMPSTVSAELIGRTIKVKGPKGEQSLDLPPFPEVSIDGQVITVNRKSEDKMHKAQHGLNSIFNQ
jgi:large subunit ribosomal protein L6